MLANDIEYTDGTPVVTDERGILVFENAPANAGPLVDENGRPLTTEVSFARATYNVIRDGINGVPVSNDSKAGLVITAIFVLAICVLAMVVPQGGMR